MERDWIPFHKRLAKGPKKSIPRGVRFVLLELSLEARATQGVLDLPLDWDTVDAIHDLIGGDVREIRKALAIFQIRDSGGVSPIEIIKDALRHRCVITKWDEWAGPKSDSERKQLSRIRQADVNKFEPLRAPSRDIVGHDRDSTPSNVTPTGQDRTGQDKTGEREARPSEVKLKSIPPPPSDETPEAQAAERPDPVRSESGFDLAKRVFGELWQAKYREDYPFDWIDNRPGSENRVLQELGDMSRTKPDPESWLRHVVRAYLRDHGDRNWLDGKRHPLRTLKRDLASYGEPPTGKHRVAPKQPAEPVAPALSVEEQGKRAREAMKAIGKIGMGGSR